jgi:ubiquinone/menaquinone biosynthesis C-methylase UbiE
MTTDSITFDRAADYYDHVTGFPPGYGAPIAAFIAQTGGLSSANRVVEVGIGTGKISLPLARHVNAVHGVDISRPMMERLRAKQTDEAVYLAQADARLLPYPDHVFDAAVVVHVFHLIPNWQQVLSELARVLKPNGLLLHGWTETDLADLWAKIDNAQKPTTVRMPLENKRETIISKGWQFVFGDIGYPYSYSIAPQEIINSIQSRQYWTTWTLSDEELSAMVSAASETFRQKYGSLDTPVEVSGTFMLEAFHAPTN